MDVLTIGPLTVRALGGPDRRGGGDGPSVLLCHGFGAAGDDLCGLSRVVDAGRDVRWFFPEAPLALDLGQGAAELDALSAVMPAARAWWNIDIARIQERILRGEAGAVVDETPAGLAEARAALEACIAELEREHGVDRERLTIGGFSQGAMLATEVALGAQHPFAGLVILSGALVSAGRWREAARSRGGACDVFMCHGRADPLLPYAAAEALRALLIASGAHVEWVPHGGGHEIPAVVVDRLGNWLRSAADRRASVRGG